MQEVPIRLHVINQMSNPNLLILNFPRTYLDNFCKNIFKDDISKFLILESSEVSGSEFLNNIGLGSFLSEILVGIVDLENDLSSIKNEYKKIPDKFKTNGFLYTIPIYRLNNSSGFESKIYKESLGMAKALFVVVDKGNANKVIEKTNMLGARGASIINARGSGVYAKKYFDANIEPEKEIVLVVCNDELEKKIVSSLDKNFSFDMPNTGILFSIELNNIIGVK